MSDGVLQFGGWVVAFLVALVSGFVQWRKGSVDESALVLGKWKELVDAHLKQLDSLQGEFAAYKKATTEEFAAYKAAATIETSDLRVRLGKAEARIIELESENAGLKRAILQNSGSSAILLGRQGERIDKLTADKTDAHKEINDHLDRIDEERGK